MTTEKKQEYTLKITNANKSEIIVIVYDLALEYLKEMKEAFTNNDFEKFDLSSKNVLACFNHLSDSLNFDFDISYDLSTIYEFIKKEVTISNIKRNISDFDRIYKMVENLKNTFSEVAKTDDSKPLMGNSQNVYAGLTYGKNTLNENMSVDPNRGLFV